MGLDDAKTTDGASLKPETASSLESCSVLVVGATGLVGSALVRQLLADKSCKEFLVLARRPLETAAGEGSSADKLRIIAADFDRLEEVLSDIRVDIVFGALGTTIKKAKTQEAFRKVDYDYPVAVGEWAKRTGAAKMVVISAMGTRTMKSRQSRRNTWETVRGEQTD